MTIYTNIFESNCNFESLIEFAKEHQRVSKEYLDFLESPSAAFICSQERRQQKHEEETR